MSFYRFADGTGLAISPTGSPKSVVFPDSEFPAVATGNLWLNTSFASNDWGRDNLFIDAMRTAQPWRAGTASEWNDPALLATMMATADADGYPTELPSGVTVAGTVILNNQAAASASVLGGRYRLDWQGSGTVAVVGGTSQTSGSGWIEFDYTPTGSNLIGINITAITPGNNIKGMRCYLLDHADLLNGGERTHPAFKAAWGGVSLIRFMQTLMINSPTPGTWAEAAKPTTIGRGASYAELVDICNEMGCSGWFNIPANADEDFVTQIATVVRDNLNPALKAYVEWANEWWNWAGFYTYGYLLDLIAGKPYASEIQQMAGGRSCETMIAWSAVFAGQMHRTVRVAGMHTQWLDINTKFFTAPDWVAEQPGRVAPHTVHDALAVTGYFSPLDKWEDILTADVPTYEDRLALLAETVMEEVHLHRDLHYPHFRTVANSYGMQMLMYEGGSHTNNAAAVSDPTLAGQLANDFNMGELIYDVYDEMMKVWDAVGDQPFNQYCSTSVESANGTFGAQHYINDFTQPRYQALMDYNDGVLPSTGIEPRPLNLKFAITGHSIPDAMITSETLPSAITAMGGTSDITAQTGPLGIMSVRWNSRPSLDLRGYLENPANTVDAFMNIEGYGGNYGGYQSVVEALRWADTWTFSLNWHNLASLRGLQRSYIANFWHDAPSGFNEAWRDSHYSVLWNGSGAPGTGDARAANLNEMQAWDALVDHMNTNKDEGTPTVYLVPWLQVMLAIWDAIDAGTVTGVTMGDFFTDDVHPATSLGRWVLCATTLAVVYHRHPNELPNSFTRPFGGTLTIDSGVAAQLRPLIWATCLATPRTGLA